MRKLLPTTCFLGTADADRILEKLTPERVARMVRLVSGVAIWSKIGFVVDFRNLLFGCDFDLSFSKDYSLMKISTTKSILRQNATPESGVETTRPRDLRPGNGAVAAEGLRG